MVLKLRSTVVTCALGSIQSGHWLGELVDAATLAVPSSKAREGWERSHVGMVLDSLRTISLPSHAATRQGD